MSNWRHMMLDDIEFLLNCQQLRIPRKASRWKLVQNLAPSNILWCQCDIRPSIRMIGKCVGAVVKIGMTSLLPCFNGTYFYRTPDSMLYWKAFWCQFAFKKLFLGVQFFPKLCILIVYPKLDSSVLAHYYVSVIILWTEPVSVHVLVLTKCQRHFFFWVFFSPFEEYY